MRSGPGKIKAATVRWGWVFAGCAVLALTWGGAALLAGQSAATAKPEQTGAQPAQTAARPAQSNVNPTQTSAQQPQSTVNQVQTETRPSQAAPISAAGETPRAEAQRPAEPRAGVAGSGDAQTQQVVQEAADLLKMATDLQAEINRTRVATLSLAVVRKANAIEELAKKMRSQP